MVKLCINIHYAFIIFLGMREKVAKVAKVALISSLCPIGAINIIYIYRIIFYKYYGIS
jgi:hypothetical protein